ncbi:MAG: RNA polymerase sigma factor [Clostridia bacterium]|nr:RNA polymerase sigma factor [Clostridia bacterium]
MNDDEIIGLYLQRNENAITETSSKYGGYLKTVALNITGDGADADECVNDAYMQAWNSIPDEAPYGYLKVFLTRLVRHAALDVCRKRNADKRSAVITGITEELEQVVPAGGDAQTELESKELGRLINAFLKKQKPLYQAVFIRRYFQAESVAAVAKSLSLSQSKVKSILFRMRNKLKEYLEREGYNV